MYHFSADVPCANGLLSTRTRSTDEAQGSDLMKESDLSPHGPPRRRSRGGAGATAALTAPGWPPAFQIPASAATLPTPPGFPSSVPLSQQAFQNWSEQITIENAWTATPATPQDVVPIANWAHGAGYTVRPRGKGHNCSPVLASDGGDMSKVIMVDTTVN